MMKSYSSVSLVPWASKQSSLSSVIIDEGITSIGNNVFNGFTALKSVILPSSVNSIGDRSFYNCIKLTNIEFTSTKEPSCGTLAFDGCLTSVIAKVPSEYNSKVFCGINLGILD